MGRWGGVAWSRVGRGGTELHQIPELMGMEEMVPGRRRDWPQGFRSRDPWRGSGDAAWSTGGSCELLMGGG